MAKLSKKIDNAIKILKLAAADAADREQSDVIINTYVGGGIKLIIK